MISNSAISFLDSREFFRHFLAFSHSCLFRDGPLEKLWGGGDFRAAGIFFAIKFLV